MNSLLELLALGCISNVIFDELDKKNILVNIVLAIVGSSFYYYSVLTPMTSLICYTLSIMMIQKQSFSKAAIKVILSFNILMIAEGIVGIIVGIFQINLSGKGLTTTLLIVFSITIVIVRYMYKFIRIKINEWFYIDPKIYVAGSVALLSIVIIVNSVNEYENIDRSFKIFIFQAMIIFIIFFIMLYINIIQVRRKNKMLELKNKYSSILDEYIQRLRACEHEYKNHLNVIYTTLQVGTVEEVNEVVSRYIEGIKDKDELTNIMYIENVIIRAIIYSKICEAKKLDINMHYDIKTSLKDFKINDLDISTILSNLLNNAIEAAKESSDRYVKISILEENKQYTVIVENSIDSSKTINVTDIFKKEYSTKGENRGYGLMNVQNLVKSNNGSIVVNATKDKFSLEIHFKG